MKITIIGPTYPYKGGISHFTTTLVHHLRKHHDVDLVSWKRQYPSFLYPVELKDTISKYMIKEQAHYLLDFFNPLSWVQAVRRIKEYKSDLVILMWVTPVQAPIYFVITLLTHIFTKTKVLYICNNVLPHESSIFDKPLAMLALGQGDSFIVHSREDKQIMETLMKNKKIIAGFLPVFSMFPKPKQTEANEIRKDLRLQSKVILFFGNIRPYKGLKYLIRAMPEIIAMFPDITLLIMGEVWEKDKQSYFDLINELHIEKNVVFPNRYIPNEDIGAYFTVADVIVLPYLTATQSGPVQIAYAFDKPVIATRVGGLKDVIEDGKTGYFIDPKNSEDIVKKVLLFFEHQINVVNITKMKNKLSWKSYIELIDEKKN